MHLDIRGSRIITGINAKCSEKFTSIGEALTRNSGESKPAF